ncbi:MAG: MBL fold metallo-hydrolase [Candidatus Hydrogenedentes bacterium]|nr:MBL fold metallo-hydrolase [Candidatus Hydrogenedentota bacterium]
MIRFSILGSGSSGNAILVVTEGARILIDCGFSLRQLQKRAAQVGQRLDELNAVFVTHEHGDHVKGLGVLARKVGIPVFMTKGTYDRLPSSVAEVPNIEYFTAGDTVALDGLAVSSFSVSHDAGDPVGFSLSYGGAKLGVAADLGYAPQLVRVRLQGAHALILESNYCPEMLRKGPYPLALQQRIRSKMGHLSNTDMSALLASLVHERLRLVVFNHVSAENNDPKLVLEIARRVMQNCAAELVVAEQHQPTRIFEVLP